MKTLYLECNMGAAGDMLAGALLELLPDPESVLRELNALGIPGVQLSLARAETCGIQGSRLCVSVNGAEEEAAVPVEEGHPLSHLTGHEHENSHAHEHSHAGWAEMESRIGNLPVSKKVREDALAVYRLIAEAESHVHGKPVDQIHFHEVGELDAVADIVSVCLLIERIAPERVVVSPIHTGSGQVRTAHGILPVPAPATAYLLRGVPAYSGEIRGELCTPTGAALLKYFADSFGAMPPMVAEAVGYGVGKKAFPAANCVRAFLGNAYEAGEAVAADEAAKAHGENGEVAELRCNMDDMTPEAIGYASRLLLQKGALDVFLTSVQMKKDRPGQMMTCLCRSEQADEMAALLLRHTSTFGVRKHICSRYELKTKLSETETPWGKVRIKTGTGYGVTKSKPEYEDAARAAADGNVPLERVYRAVLGNME